MLPKKGSIFVEQSPHKAANMEMNKRILVIDDDNGICMLLERFLTKQGFEVSVAASGKSGLDLLSKSVYQVVLCDFRLPDYEGMDLLDKIRVDYPQVQVIIITGYSDVRVAVKSIQHGAFDYVTKPLFPEEILATIKKALETEPITAKTNKTLAPSKNSGAKPSIENNFIAGTSPAIVDVLNMVKIVAPTNISVLIQGETGAGKEYIAKAIHLASNRKDAPFIAVDCGAIPKDLASSELFGHVKGAFTSAITNRIGHFEAADGGTLFLDEIGNLSYDTQVKLLRALQERVISKVGDTKSIKVDVRIIAASNDNLLEAVKEGKFREDLYHRLNEIKIKIPPLRERKEDILTYAEHFLKISNHELEKQVKGFDPDFVEVLHSYPWHGNLRELKNIIKRCTLLTQKDTIGVITLPEEIIGFPRSEPQVFTLDNSGDLKSASSLAEKATILSILQKVNNNKTKAAEMLKIDRKTLYNKMRQFNIGVEDN